MKKRLSLIFLSVLLAIPVSLFGIMGSEKGTRWLLQTVLPANISIQTINGTLLNHLSLDGLHYHDASVNAEVQHIVFAWQPRKLFKATLKINELSANDATINFTPTNEPKPESKPFDFNAPLLLPLNVIVENLLLTNIRYQQGEQSQILQKLQLSAKTENNQLIMQTLDINAKPLAATLNGQVHLGKGFTFHLNTDWSFDAEANGNWQASTEISGDTQKIILHNRINAPFQIDLKGIIDKPLKDERFINLRLDWQDVKYPITGPPPQVQSAKGHLSFKGLLSDYQLQLNAQLNHAYLPNSSLILDSKGSLEAINIVKLALKSTTGNLELGGQVGWKDKTTFDIIAKAQNFNPAIVLPDMAGNLSLDSRFKGEFADKLQLNAAINSLAGQLRGYPVSANGSLLLAGDLLTVNSLNFNFGRNHVAVNGTMGQEQARLNFSINAPAMNTLWSGLAGNLQAQGSLQGAWQTPAINLQTTGRGLRFNQHSLEQLNANIAYDGQTLSQLNILANRIQSGATQISRVLLTGQGALTQHRLTAEVDSQYADVRTTITGAMTGDNWQGSLAQLMINNKDAGLWQLRNAMPIRATKNAQGRDISTEQGCLIQHRAALCMQGGYFANGDFTGQLAINDLSSNVIHAFLPHNIQLVTALNGAVSVQQRNKLLSGQYHLQLTPLRISVQDKELQLGASSISGKLDGTRVSADIDLALIARDGIRGHLNVDSKSQALSGQIAASITEFAAVKPFVPQLSELSAQFKTQLALSGTISKPAINGNIDLMNGKITLVDSGVSMNDINVHAQANSGVGYIWHTVVQGSLNPSIAIKPNTDDSIRIDSRININAEFQQAEHLTGHYEISIPPINIQLARAKIPLGATSLSGKLTPNRIFNDLNIALVKQDYIRSQLELATDDSKIITGQLNALIGEFSAFNVLVPQISNLAGQIKADISIAGTKDNPTATGAIKLSSGTVDIRDLGMQLRDINFQAQTLAANADRLQIAGSAKSGTGQIKLNGALELAAGLPVDITITGSDFEVAKTPKAQVAISPQLKFLFANRKGNVTGKIAIPKALIRLEEIPESAIQVSKDEVIMDEEKLTDKQIKPTLINADIQIELGNNVNFAGLGFKTDLQGTVQLQQTGAKTAVRGTINLKNALFKKYGQDLTVRKGVVVFNGAPDNPILNVEAIRVSNNRQVTAVLTVTGTANSPKISVSSEPTLPETDALAYLITGRSLSQASGQQGQMIASAALSYGAGQMSWLTEKLGLDEFEIKEGDTLQNTQLAIGQYITPDFYLGTRIGLFNKQASLLLRHNITSWLNVETEAGESQRIRLNYEMNRD
jgi:translocation and assembly module TamB